MYYRNVVNIFEKCEFDVDLFLEKYPETRCLSKQEIIALYSYCETGKKYNFCFPTGIHGIFTFVFIYLGTLFVIIISFLLTKLDAPELYLASKL